jgi:two-component system, NarL family, invasion response regulator UvrY
MCVILELNHALTSKHNYSTIPPRTKFTTNQKTMTPATTIKVLIVEDHAVMRRGLIALFADTEDIVVGAETGSGLEAIRICRDTDCQVILLDISLPDRNGIEVLKQIKKENPQLAILMFSMHQESLYAMRALRAGAAGYLNKQCLPADIVTAVRQVANGLKYISPSLAQQLANQIDVDQNQPLHNTLSDREYQTLTMIASGKTVSAIARELSLSVKTVSEYRSRILVKMKLKNSAELTLYVIQNQLQE